MLKRLYDWTMALAESPRALWALAFISFVESSVFPIPPDVMLIPMVIAAPHKAWRIAAVCTVSSVLGGIFGYFIGAFLFDTIGQPILAFYGKEENFSVFAARYNEYGAWAVLIAGITPFPYKIVTILSGSTGLSFPVFIIASIVARGFRFYIVAALLWKYGPPIRDFIERRLGLMFTLFMITLLGGFAAVKYL